MAEAQLLWDVREPGDSLRVERSDGDNTNFVEVANLPGTAQEHKETVPDGTYFYRVRGETGAVFTDYSNEAEITFGGAPDPIVIHDSFAGALNSRVVGRTPDLADNGNVWTVSANGANDDCFFINASNQAEADATGGTTYRGPIIDAGISDCVVSCDFVARAGGGIFGLCFRTSDNNYFNAWYVEATSSQINLREGSSIRGQLAVGTYGGTGTAVVTLDGDSIAVEWQGSIATGTINYTSATRQTVTTHGLVTNRAGNILDNFKVEQLP